MGTSASTRRNWLQRAFFGAGALGLRQLATGLPAAVLLNPKRALTQSFVHQFAASRGAQTLVYSTSGAGDPINCNVPGSYVDATLRHPADARMAATTLTLGQTTSKAAAVWGKLSAATLARTSFFHHATELIAHSSQATVQTLASQVNHGDMLVSAYARLLAPVLGTVQAQPLVISGVGGNETIAYQGSSVANLSVQGIKAILLQPGTAAAINGLKTLRDQTLSALNADLQDGGTAPQKAFLANYATSQTQLRQISESALDGLNSLQDNDTASQLSCAAILAQLKISPAIVVHVPFGGDNHGDTALNNEVEEHVASTGALAAFFGNLANMGLADKVTFALMNVFGRDNSSGALSGRNHNDQHSVGILSGVGVRGGVVGGAVNHNNAANATNIDPTTGGSVSRGGIEATDSLSAFGKTLGMALGIPSADVEALVSNGSVVTGALAT